MLAPARSETPVQVFERIDRAAAGFKSFAADIRRLTHTDVINSDEVDTGTVKLKRPKPRDVRLLIVLTDPDPKSVAIQGKTAEMYFPRMQTVQQYDLGKNREMVDEFLLLGFGSTSKELQDSYLVQVLGPETVGGQKTTRLELIPKSKEVLQHLKKCEMWISDASGIPVQQKFYFQGQYFIATYTNIKVNPDLPDSALKLQLPKGVKREFPQR